MNRDKILKDVASMVKDMVTTARRLCDCRKCYQGKEISEDDWSTKPASCVANTILKPMVDDLIGKFDFDPEYGD